MKVKKGKTHSQWCVLRKIKEDTGKKKLLQNRLQSVEHTLSCSAVECLIALFQSCHLPSPVHAVHKRTLPLMQTDIPTLMSFPLYLSISEFSAPFQA